MNAIVDFRSVADDAAARATTAPDPKQPLFRPLPPPEAFPLAALGALEPAASAVQQLTQAPAAICAQSVLAAATLAVQAHYDVELPTGRKPLTALFLSIAESGERKTSTDALATEAIKRHEARLAELDEAARAAHWADREAWKSATDAAKKANAKGGRAAIREALETIGAEPKAPPLPMLLIADPSPEALALHLADGRPWAGLFTDEAAILVGGHAFNDETKMRTGALLNTLWDGAPIRRLRVLTGARFAPDRRCTAHLMMQPNVADKLLGDPTLSGIGTLARMLVVAPKSTAGSRPWAGPDLGAKARLGDYQARLAMLLERQPRLTKAGGLDPRPLPLHSDARRLFIQFHDSVEGQIGDGGRLATIRAFGSKMPEHAGRLAAVLTAYADPDAAEVTAEAMGYGIILAQHYAAEMLRLLGGSAVDPDLRLAARLLEWLQQRQSPRCHARDIYQFGPNAMRDAATTNRIMGILERHGWVKRLPPGTVLEGAARREAWEMI
jgi:hypothetical protein